VCWRARGAETFGFHRQDTGPAGNAGALACCLPLGSAFAHCIYAIPGSAQTISVDPDSDHVSVTQNPRFLQWGGSLQYSMPYLKSSIVDLRLPDS
jgi:hypothetical protein